MSQKVRTGRLLSLVHKSSSEEKKKKTFGARSPQFPIGPFFFNSFIFMLRGSWLESLPELSSLVRPKHLKFRLASQSLVQANVLSMVGEIRPGFVGRYEVFMVVRLYTAMHDARHKCYPSSAPKRPTVTSVT